MNRLPGNKLSLLLNVFCLSTVCYGLYYHFFVLVLPSSLARAGINQFLTILSGYLTVVYNAVSIYSHITADQRLFYIKNNYYLPGVLVAEFIVSSLYWSFQLLVSHLVMIEFQLPLDVDLVLHLVPFACVFADYMLFIPQIHTSYFLVYAKLALMGYAYWVWVHYIVDITQGSFPYPVFTVIFPVRIAVFFFAVSFGFLGFSTIRMFQEFAIRAVKKYQRGSRVGLSGYSAAIKRTIGKCWHG